MDMSRTSAVLLRTQSDERLVALARAGHERAFETIVRRYRRQLLSACRRMVDDGRAEDVLQQALLAAWGALRRGDEVRDLRAWLFRVVRNAAVSHRRRAGHDGSELVDALSVAASPQEEAERRAVVQETLEAIAGLPERQREALLRIAVQGRSQEEVADDLGVSTIAVRQLVHRARTSLRSAATAVAPVSLVTWAASAGAGGGEPLSLRIAGLIASAGGATVFAKAGVVAGVAVTAVSAPLVLEHRRPPAPRVLIAAPRPAPARERAVPVPRPSATPVAARPVAATPTPHAPARRPAARPTAVPRTFVRRRSGSSESAPVVVKHEHDDAAREDRPDSSREDDATGGDGGGDQVAARTVERSPGSDGEADGGGDGGGSGDHESTAPTGDGGGGGGDDGSD